MPVLAYNKRANFDYKISDKYEVGIILLGHEVKSVKTGHISLKGSFVTIKRGQKELPELYLTNAYIPLYKKARIRIVATIYSVPGLISHLTEPDILEMLSPNSAQIICSLLELMVMTLVEARNCKDVQT